MGSINNYRETKTVVSYIVHHIVFCTRYKRKLFLEDKLSRRVRELIEEKCNELNVEILKLNIEQSHVEMVIESPPDLSPNQIVYRIKSYCNMENLKVEFDVLKKMPNVWTRSCLISTDILDEEVIESYVLAQK